jgi:hypothetical protein
MTSTRSAWSCFRGFPGPLLLPAPLITEIGYMLHSRAGSRAEADFLRDIADGVYELVQVTAADALRAASLVERTRACPSGPQMPLSSRSRRGSAR